MRTYGPSSATKQGKKQEYRSRTSCEWDVRCTLHSNNHDNEIKDIEECIELNTSRLLYALIGGIEYNTSDQSHVHIALIFKQPQTRHAVLHTLHRDHVKNEYAAPRNNQHSYTGWKLHHIKHDTKISDKHLIYEYGQLPNEQLTTKQWKTCKQFGYQGEKPTIQQKINFTPTKQPTAKVPRVREDNRKGDRHVNRPRVRPIGRQRTPERIASALERIAKYTDMLSEALDISEQDRIRNIISKIEEDWIN